MEISYQDSKSLLTDKGLSRPTIVENLITFLFFFTIFLVFVNPPVDNDMPWHLKTGEYILTNMHLPSIDPFSYANTTVSALGHFILTQYWLAQILFWIVFLIFGVKGFVLLIAIIFSLIAFLLYSMIREINHILALLVIGCYFSYFILGFNTLRPQIFTFLFSTLTIFLIQKYKDTNRDWYLTILPCIFLFWANMHGGFIFGIVIFCVFLVSELTYIILSLPDVEKYPKITIKKILVTAIVSFFFCYFNPNGYEAFSYAFRSHSTTVFSSIMEYQSPLQLDSLPPSNMMNFWFTIPFSMAVIILGLMKKKIFPTFLTVFTMGMAFTSIRYFPLLVITTTAAIGQVSDKFELNISKIMLNALNFIMIIILIGFSGFSLNKIDKNTFDFSVSPYNPAKAINFLKSNKISGNIYGSYNKSSHLILGLFPESKVFWSSNFISVDRFEDGLVIGGKDVEKKGIAAMYSLFPKESNVEVQVSFSPNDKKNYEKFLKKIEDSGTEIIVHEAINVLSGEPFPLVFLLLELEEWKLIYADGEVLIFLKNIPKFKEKIEQLSKPKELLFNQLIIEGTRGWGINRTNFPAIAALGYLLKGDSGGFTEELILDALGNNPKNQYALIDNIIIKKLKQRKMTQND